MKILIIEDNKRLADNLQTILKHETYAVDVCHTLTEARQKVADEPYDLILLDRMLPDGDGRDFCATVRENGSHTPILMLTAKTQLEQKVEGLDAGADDYVTKPYDAEELCARVRALLRRNEREVRNPTIAVGNLLIDTNNHSVFWKNKPILLSQKEYSLLEYLAIHKNQALTRDQLLSHAWDENADPFSNTVDVHVAFLRTKFRKNGITVPITTVKGVGYVLSDKN
ncbi:MAG: response regulator transcription factor [Patescibacteria group bacterium]|jgi:DNA-binding response OmpR family regulator